MAVVAVGLFSRRRQSARTQAPDKLEPQGVPQEDLQREVAAEALRLGVLVVAPDGRHVDWMMTSCAAAAHLGGADAPAEDYSRVHRAASGLVGLYGRSALAVSKANYRGKTAEEHVADAAAEWKATKAGGGQ